MCTGYRLCGTRQSAASGRAGARESAGKSGVSTPSSGSRLWMAIRKRGWLFPRFVGKIAFRLSSLSGTDGGDRCDG